MLGAVALVAQCIGLYGPPAPSIGTGLPVDKIGHVVGFAVPVALFLAAGIRWWLVVTLAFVQAVVSEVVQGLFLADRSGDVLDLLADLIGIGCGLGIGLLTHRLRTRVRLTD